MKKKYFSIMNDGKKIPSVLWGEENSKILVVVHGNFSSKEDIIISNMAEIAIEKGYQVLSFDLPGHGDNKEHKEENFPKDAVSDLVKVYEYANKKNSKISIFAVSIGAYLSMIAYDTIDIEQSLFLSPIVNLDYIIEKMMESFGISKKELKKKSKIELPINYNLYWEYYNYIKNNPISNFSNKDISILYGEKDDMTDWETIAEFSQKYNADIEISKDTEHFFHKENHIKNFRKWFKKELY